MAIGNDVARGGGEGRGGIGDEGSGGGTALGIDGVEVGEKG